MDLALRPMSTSQVLDRTFYLYRNNFVLFAGIAIITPALRLISQLIQLQIFGPLVMPQQPEAMTPQFLQALFVRGLIGTVVGVAVYLVGTALASGATAHAVSMVHLGKTTTIVESYSKIKPIFGRIVWLLCTVMFFAFGPLILGYTLILAAAFGMAFAIKGSGSSAFLGFALVILLVSLVVIIGAVGWAFFALCRYAVAVPSCTLENLPAMRSIKRSRFLTNGAKGSVFGIILLTGIMTFVLTYVLQLPALIANSAVFVTSRTHLSMAATAWIFIADFLGSALAGPIATIALVLVYYDQRVRKEAFDLQLMMEAVGEQPPQTMAAAAQPPIG